MLAIAGVDATARGAIFGPDIAAAVILKPGCEFYLEKQGVRDSKKTSGRERTHLRKLIHQHCIAWSLGFATVEEINRNSDYAEYLAMQRAVMGLSLQPDKVLVDGIRTIPGLSCKQTAIAQGDSKELCIAAASILAKAHHDELVEQWDREYPGYGLIRNKAHCTLEHESAIAELGLTKLHRNCAVKFANQQLSLFPL